MFILYFLSNVDQKLVLIIGQHLNIEFLTSYEKLYTKHDYLYLELQWFKDQHTNCNV